MDDIQTHVGLGQRMFFFYCLTESSPWFQKLIYVTFLHRAFLTRCNKTTSKLPYAVGRIGVPYKPVCTVRQNLHLIPFYKYWYVKVLLGGVCTTALVLVPVPVFLACSLCKNELAVYSIEQLFFSFEMGYIDRWVNCYMPTQKGNLPPPTSILVFFFLFLNEIISWCTRSHFFY